jgi:hypothetical protein
LNYFSQEDGERAWLQTEDSPNIFACAMTQIP